VLRGNWIFPRIADSETDETETRGRSDKGISLIIPKREGSSIMATKILVADDEPDVLLIIKTGLTMEGFEVLTAANGRDALLSAMEELPDLIILDVMMPI
jgi:PleD family two-component response regulator